MLVSVLCCVVDPPWWVESYVFLAVWIMIERQPAWNLIQSPVSSAETATGHPFHNLSMELYTQAASIHLARHSQRKFKWISKTEAKSTQPAWVSSSALKQTTIEESVVERMILVVTYLPTIPREYPVPCWLQEEPKSNFYFVLRSSTRCWPPSYIL